jgi:hypothetical protein
MSIETSVQISIGRVAIAAIVAEVLAIGALLLVLPVVIFSDPLSYGMAETFGRRLANWVMPIAGFGSCLLGGWWAARKLRTEHVRAGIFVGVAAALMDVAFLASLGAPLRTLFVVSELGRIAGAALGGRLAARNRAATQQAPVDA